MGKHGNSIRVLVCSDSFYPPRGGGDFSLRNITEQLAGHGYGMHACYMGGAPDPIFDATILKIDIPLRGLWPRAWALNHPWKSRLGKVIARIRPDVVLAQQTAMVPTIEVCKAMDVPVIAFLRSVDVFCLGSYWSGMPWKCRYRCVGCADANHRLMQFPFFRLEMRRILRALPRADLIVANSQFMRKTLADILGLRSILVTPLTRIEGVQGEKDENGSILFFTPLDYKGVETAISIAEALKDDRFLFVGESRPRWVKRLKELSNIEYVPWSDDVSQCYRKSRLLIVPSVWPEAFGRVCVEAMSRGIPCVVSGVGALPETIGQGGDVVALSRDVSAWVDALLRYRNCEYYEEKSRKAIEETGRYSQPEIDELISAIESMVAP